MERKIIYLDDAIDALRYAQHRFTVADEAGGMGTVKWSEDVIYFATAERVLAELPSAQPELPKQFMSDDCISRSELYKKVCEAEKLARERVLDTPSDSPFPNKLNPAYTRYSAQLNERTQFKHMIADTRSVQPELRWIPFKTRPLTKAEKEEHPEWDDILDSKLPDDGQRILVSVSVRGHESVQYDKFYTDDGSYLDSGYEIGTEATAWMPLPDPYKTDIRINVSKWEDKEPTEIVKEELNMAQNITGERESPDY